MILAPTKNYSRLIAPSALGLALLLTPQAQAGFQWITPVDQGPVATQPTVDKTPVEQKKEMPSEVQLPALEQPVEAAPAPMSEPAVTPQAAMPMPEPTVAPQTTAPLATAPEPAPAPAVVEHDAVPAAPMDIETPQGDMPAPAPVVIEPHAEAPTPPLVVLDSDLPKMEEPVPAPAPVIEQKAETPVTMPEMMAPQVAETPAPIAPTPVHTGLAAMDPGQKVEGFGKEMPLVVVLKQLLPKDHVFAFEQGIDPATPVSWKGGRGWRLALADALHSAGLDAHEENNLVSIVRGQIAEQMPVAMAQQPAPLPEIVPAPVVTEMPEIVPQPVVAEATSVTEAPLPLTVAPEPAPIAEPVVPPAAPEAAAPVVGKIVMPNAMLEPPLLPGASDMWKADPGEHLRAVIKRWCDRAKVELVWSTEYDYPIQAGVNLTGSFEEAVRDLLSGFVDAKPQPFGRLHDNPAAGQRTLVIQARGNTNGE